MCLLVLAWASRNVQKEQPGLAGSTRAGCGSTGHLNLMYQHEACKGGVGMVLREGGCFCIYGVHGSLCHSMGGLFAAASLCAIVSVHTPAPLALR